MENISIIIPSYNRAGHIGNVIQSLLEQTLLNDEIIVVDDCSSDQSVQIINQFPVHLIEHSDNKGPATARNTGLELAKNDIVLFIDSDAYAAPGLLDHIKAIYQQDEKHKIGGVGGQGMEDQVNSTYDLWRKYHANQSFGDKPKHNVSYLFGLCASYRREVLLEVGGFDPFYRINAGEDLDIGYRVRKAGYRLYYEPKAVVYHQHSDDEESLFRVQFNWFYWSYMAKYRTSTMPWTLFAGTIRRLFTDTFTDLIIRRSIQLSKLDLRMFYVKMTALWDAHLTARKLETNSDSISDRGVRRG